MTTLHIEDRRVAYNFIDYVRLYRKENVNLEIAARHLATFLGINPDLPNHKIANEFSTLFETNKIK